MHERRRVDEAAVIPEREYRPVNRRPQFGRNAFHRYWLLVRRRAHVRNPPVRAQERAAGVSLLEPLNREAAREHPGEPCIEPVGNRIDVFSEKALQPRGRQRREHPQGIGQRRERSGFRRLRNNR